MKILFDFDLFGEVSVDSHLLDIMAAFKGHLILELAPYSERIKANSGFVIVHLKPTGCGMIYMDFKGGAFSNEVQSCLDSLDWESWITKLGVVGLN